MTSGKAGRMALKLAGAALVFGAAGCDPNQHEKEAAAHNAKVEKAEADDKVQRQANFSVECINAMQWKKAFLAGAGVGGIDIYVKHYRAQLEKTLGDSAIPAADGAPELSKGAIDPYLAWAYDNDVKTKFTAGKDFNQDGKVTPAEANAQGNARVASCIMQAAEAGVGPLAGKDKVARMFKMDAFRARIDKSN